MELKAYTLEELEPYLYILYSKPDSLVPVSPLRLRSYMENPRARKSDTVLFEMRENGEVIAYRTLLPDIFYDHKGEPQRFAWLSGNWVRPDKRRQGNSTRLLEMAEDRWQGRLMYTNYAPESKEVYDRTGRFERIALREGSRFYLRSSFDELLNKRVGNTRLFGMADRFINQLREKRIQSYEIASDRSCGVSEIDGFLSQLSELVKRLQQDALFRRDREIFKWALEFPWVTEQACGPLHYHFSYQANRFENILLQFSSPAGKIMGVMWMILHDSLLTVPYFFAGSEEVEACMADQIVRTMIEKDCTYTTIRNQKLLKHLQKHRKLFLGIRQMPQLVFAHQSLMDLMPGDPVIHDGDGDVMFTG